MRETDFQIRLEAFAAAYDGDQQPTLPAWDAFSHHYGTSRLARQLFVDMQRAEPELLDALATDPRAASQALSERGRQILDGDRESLANLGTLATLLFVGSAEHVTVDEDSCLHIYPFVVQSTYHRNHKSPLWPGLLKKMVGTWIAKDTTAAMTNQNLILASQLELKDEALTISERVLDDEYSQIGSRQIAILMLGRFGGRPQMARLEKLLADTTSCGMVQIDNPPRQVELQLRDVALAALLYRTDQNLRDYGYLSVQEYATTVFQVGTLGFADEKVRDAALQKWAQWRAAHPQT